MTTDKTTKILLLLIALGLFLNVAAQLWRPEQVQAQSRTTCTGELTANAWGGVKEIIGGYSIKLDCR